MKREVVEEIAEGAVGRGGAEVVVEVGVGVGLQGDEIVVDAVALGLDFVPDAEADDGLLVDRVDGIVLGPIERLELGGVEPVVEAANFIRA